MRKILIITIVLIAVVGGVIYYNKFSIDNAPASTSLPTYLKTAEEQGMHALLLDLKKSTYEEALKTDKLIVLYFYANWCPICQAEFPLMEQAFGEFATDKVIGFRVNYNDNQTDSDEEALAREYGVAYQHTKVFVRSGERIGKWPDSWDKSRYLSEINSRL